MASTARAQESQKPHTALAKLEDQAAQAALHVAKHDKLSKDGQEFLDGNKRLSSAGASASLKYANPQDLPSYPSPGLKNYSAAGAAASLGWANQKPFEPWKPDASATASAAAIMAKDYKAKEPWQPEQSTHGAKAAVLAHKDGGKVETWKPEADSLWGSSAALQAFKKFGAGGLSPMPDYGYTDLGRKGSLMAATGAMSHSRKRATSTPDPKPKTETYPDESNAAANALSAATSAHRTKRSEASDIGGSTPYTTMAREMYTSNPPVAPEVEERNRADTLRASAVAMAKQMYNIQQSQFEQTSHAQRGASAAHHRKSSSSDISDEIQPMRFTNLQQAAQKLAQERLAKLHDEHARNREYRDYYGGNSQPTSRLSIRGRVRRRASSDGCLDNDKEQSLFPSNISPLGAKRTQDREALIAVAQRNVTKSLHNMDERVFANTGKIAPSLLSEWEVKAHAAAQAKSDSRMENYGKVHIGGGKFIDQNEVDAVARGNVQPVLDEINERAVSERDHQAAAKAEQVEIARKTTEKKQREKESKAINKKLKQQDKEEEKLRLQEAKEERKAAQRAEKEKRKSTTGGVIFGSRASEPAATSALVGTTTVTEVEGSSPTTTREAPAPPPTSLEDQAGSRKQGDADAANLGESIPLSPDTTDKGKSRISWLKTKFSRRLSRSQKGPTSEGKEPKDEKSEKGFVGGVALTGGSAKDSPTAPLGYHNSVATSSKPETSLPVELTAAEEPEAEAEASTEITPNEPNAQTLATVNPATEVEESVSLPLTSKTQEPALTNDEDERIGRPLRRREDHVSPIPSGEKLEKDTEKPEEEEDEEFQEARDNFDEDLAPPPIFPAAKGSSPAREAKFTEIIE